MSESLWNDPRITAYVLNELSDEEKHAFELEVQSNAELSAAVEEARGVTGQLADLYASETTRPLEPGRREAIFNQESAASEGAVGLRDPTATPRRSGKVVLFFVAAAATLLLVAGIAPWLNRQDADRVAMDSSPERSADESQMTQSVIAPESLPPGNDRLRRRDESPQMDTSGEEALSIIELSARASGESDAAGSEPDANQVVGKSKARELTNEAMSSPVAGPAPGRGVVSPVWTIEAERARPAAAEFLAERLEASAALEPVQQGEQTLSVATKSMPDRRTALAAAQPLAKAEDELTRARMDVRFGRSVTLGKELSRDRRFFLLEDQGRGPGIAGDQFDPITENAFGRVLDHPLSTFSVDVDTASYSKVRDVLLRANQLPRPDAVRIEEMVNYFEYDYAPPADDAEHPFAARADITSCPWNPEHRLARVSLQGKTMAKDERPQCNLVFLLDTSGSMNAPNKLPLVIQGMKMLLGELNRNDRVAIAVYAGSAGLVLDSTSAKKTKKIRNALTQLSAGGSTNGGAGIALAYQTARDHFITDGVNRVILCTDGDFNVGTTSTDELVRMVENEAQGGVYLSVLGFGMGNHNDAMLERVSGQGNGNYAFIDTEQEARKVLVDQTNATLVTIAKNVKMQVEFNPQHVSSYRLIGYENRLLAKEDFNNDKKDAGEIGAGHSVTALYELVPADAETGPNPPEVDQLKFQTERQLTAAADSDVTMTLKLRYLAPDANVEEGDESTRVEVPVIDQGDGFESADLEFRFAAAVAGFGMKLRRSEHLGDWTLKDVLEVAVSSSGKDKYELRAEFADLVRKARVLMGED